MFSMLLVEITKLSGVSLDFFLLHYGYLGNKNIFCWQIGQIPLHSRNIIKVKCSFLQNIIVFSMGIDITSYHGSVQSIQVFIPPLKVIQVSYKSSIDSIFKQLIYLRYTSCLNIHLIGKAMLSHQSLSI